MTPLEKLINERGIKRNWIAQQIGVSNGTMTRLVNGTGKPTIDVAFKISRLLEVSMEELWGHLVE